MQGTHTGGIGAPLADTASTVKTEGQAVGEAGTPHMPSRVLRRRLLRAAVHLRHDRNRRCVSKCSKSSGMTHGAQSELLVSTCHLRHRLRRPGHTRPPKLGENRLENYWIADGPGVGARNSTARMQLHFKQTKRLASRTLPQL